MSSFYDRWGHLARHCAKKRVEPELACEMQQQRLDQAEAYYTWVSKRRDARKVITSPDPMLYPDNIPLLRTDWMYANALGQMDGIGWLPHNGGLFVWARLALLKMCKMSADELYGPEAQWSEWADWTPWGQFTNMVLMNLHIFAHYVKRKTPYSDNPYKGGRRVPNWTDADAWAEENGFPTR